LRLVTPTDPEGVQGENPAIPARSVSEGDRPPSLALQASMARYYQLTHDYLIPSLRQWLTCKHPHPRPPPAPPPPPHPPPARPAPPGPAAWKHGTGPTGGNGQPSAPSPGRRIGPPRSGG